MTRMKTRTTKNYRWTAENYVLIKDGKLAGIFTTGRTAGMKGDPQTRNQHKIQQKAQ